MKTTITTGQAVAELVKAHGGRAWTKAGKWGWIAPNNTGHAGKFCMIQATNYGPAYAVKSKAARSPGGHERWVAGLLEGLGVGKVIVDGDPDPAVTA